jgi:hypothetical protein
MAESNTVPASPAGGPATPPRILPWLLIYTVGRLGIAAASRERLTEGLAARSLARRAAKEELRARLSGTE